MNADFKLKILRSESIFDTSEEALKYIEKYLEDNIAEGEPAVVYYGEDKEHPNVILCIGNGKEKNAVYTVDFQAIKDQLATISEEEATAAEELATAVTKIEGILKAVDLSCDVINGEIVISYNPDPKDIVIGDAETIADALAKLSAYAQEVANTVQFEVADTNTIALTKEDGVLSADVKFSELGDTSVAGVDDNIVGAFDDGIYAVAHLDYEDETKTITFTTSGYDENGAFKRDANVTTIKLGEHTLYKADNEDHNLKVTIDNTEMTISADAKISEDSDNILTVNDGKLYVKGRANNIIYKNTNVRDALDDLYKEVAEAGKNTEYNDSDTIKFTTTEDANGELNVTADVKLASNNSINIADGGLNVNLAISINAAENTLTVQLGDTKTTYDLPDAKIIDHIEFKDGDLILWYDNDKYVTIPLEGLVAHYVFENDNEHTVHLDADVDSDGIYHVYATVKLRSSDNLISHNSTGELFVSKEDVEAIVSSVSDEIIERLKTVEEKVATIENQMAVDEISLKAIQAQVETNTTNIATNASDIAALKEEVKEVEAEVKVDEETIANLTTEVSKVEEEVKEVQTEVSTNTTNIAVLTTRTDTIDSEIATLNGDDSTVGSVAYVVKVAQDTLEAEITSETEKREEQDSDLQKQIDALSAQVSGDEESILASAKEYTDTQVEKVQTALDIEIERAKSAEEGLQSSVDTIEGEITTINDSLANKIESVTVQKINDLQYQILVDGKGVEAMIDIPDAIILNSTSYDPTTHILTLVFNTTNGEQTVTVDLSTLVDVYEAGNGLSLDDGKFSIKINSQSQGYLTVDDSGLTLTGVAGSDELKEATDELQAQITTNADAIVIINGNEAQEGSVKNAIATSEAYTDEKVNNATDELQEQITANADAIAIINGNEAQEGSVKNAIATSEAYTDEKVKQASDDLQAEIEALQNEVCDAGDGLEKVETENGHKFNVKINSLSQTYLSVDSSGLSLAGVAGSDELATTNENVAANAKAIEDLSASVSNDKFHTADTSTIELTLKEGETSESSKELSAKVILSSQSKNNIVDNGGLYSVANFDYNAATNEITFTNSDGERTFVINSAGSLVVGGYYDSANHAVVLIVSDGAGETHEISIPISDLIYDIDVHNDVNDPVELEISTDSATGAKVISATLRISSDSDNLIDVDNGALFASNEAKDMYCTSGEGTQTSIQQVITEYYNDIKDINNAIASLEQGAEGTTSDITKLEEKVDANASDIASLKEELSEVEADVADLKQGLDDVKEELAELQKCLGDICANETSVADRLDNIESIIENLIDFGSYQED